MDSTRGDNNHGQIEQRQVDKKAVETCVKRHMKISQYELKTDELKTQVGHQ
jgi:hypothetical protein